MRKFLVIYSKKEKKKAPFELLKDHICFLKELEKKEKLILCGPLLDQDRALLLINASSKENVLNLIHRDPFIQTKYYQAFEVTEFLEANSQNHFLLNLEGNET